MQDTTGQDVQLYGEGLLGGSFRAAPSALVRLIPRVSLLVGCQGSHGHIRIPLDVSITGDLSSCFVADFFF